MALITGTPGDDELTGTPDDDTIDGLDGNDTLNGVGGTNTLSGGLGNDTYIVGTLRTSFFGPGPAQDTIIELAGQGTETVRTAVSFTLGNNLENLVLAASLGDVLHIQFVGQPIDFVNLERVADATNPIVGGWMMSAGTTKVAITFQADGTYMHAEDGVAEGGGQSGMERGTFTWDAVSGAFTSTTITDTNGTWGISDSSITSMKVDGNTLTVVDGGDTLVLTRVASATNAIVGSWHLADTGDGADHVEVTFLANGTYMFAEEHAVDDATGENGMERGTYTWNATTGAFHTVTLVDTSGDWGFSDSPASTAGVLTSSGTGNELDNVITGNAANNVLTGLDGNDTLNGMEGVNKLVGGLGNDTYVIGLGQDTLIELAGQGTDTVRSSISYTLGNNLENLELADTLGDVLRFVDSGETVFLTRVADAANPIVGTWHFADSSGEAVITFMADGSYMMAEDGAPDPSGQPGMEHGTYTWNPETGAFSSNTTTDTNGEWGLSHSNISSVELNGDTLTVVDSGETINLTRVADAGNPIVGTWHFADSLGEAVVTFMANGSYMMAEDGAPDPSGEPGMEHGTYTWNAATGAFHSITTTDTNGEWGLSEDSPYRTSAC